MSHSKTINYLIPLVSDHMKEPLDFKRLESLMRELKTELKNEDTKKSKYLL